MLQTAAFVHLDLAVHLSRMMNDDADEIDINDDYYDYSNVGRLFCTPAPPKFTKKLAVDSFFNFGS